MARQVRNKMGWDEGSINKIAERTGLLRIIRNIVGINRHVTEYTNSVEYGRIEGFKTSPGFASVKEAEALLRTARIFQ